MDSYCYTISRAQARAIVTMRNRAIREQRTDVIYDLSVALIRAKQSATRYLALQMGLDPADYV